MTPVELKDLFRGITFDSVSPYFFSDVEIYTWMALAQEKFCREVQGIPDSSTASVCAAAVVDNDKFVSISPLILKLRHVQRRSDSKPLEILNFEDMNKPSLQTDYGFQRNLRLDGTKGPLASLIVGMEPHKVRLVPVAQEADTLDFIVYRLPLLSPTAVNPLEVDPQHHYYLLHWMMHLAYAKQDAETFDKAKAEAEGEKFLAYCREAKQEKDRTEHKYRTVAYGGI